MMQLVYGQETEEAEELCAMSCSEPMQTMKIIGFVFLFGYVAMGQEVVATNVAPPALKIPGPHMQFATTNYDFQVRWAGETIKYDFVFTNTGDQTLEIKDVHTSCGCATATNWQRTIAVGQSGQIPVQFNSANFSGPVAKTVTVTCNDPAQQTIILKIHGTIKKAIDMRPAYVYFTSSVEGSTNNVRTVRILNQTETSLTLSEPVCTNRIFEVALATIVPGKEFELKVMIRPPLQEGVSQGHIVLKTSLTNFPTLTVNAMAMVQPIIRVSPTEIFMPVNPLAATLRRSITLRNNSTNPVSFSEPKINFEGIEIQTQENQPGQASTYTLTFPVGFQVPTNHTIEFTVQTSCAQKPVIRVPLKQTAFPNASLSRFNNPVTKPAPVKTNSAPVKQTSATQPATQVSITSIPSPTTTGAPPLPPPLVSESLPSNKATAPLPR